MKKRLLAVITLVIIATIVYLQYDKLFKSKSIQHVSTISKEVSLLPYWQNFFIDAGIPAGEARNYAIIFTVHRIQRNMLHDLNKEYLGDMGFHAMGDVITVLKHARTVAEQTKLHTKTTPTGDMVQEAIPDFVVVKKSGISHADVGIDVKRNTIVVKTATEMEDRRRDGALVVLQHCYPTEAVYHFKQQHITRMVARINSTSYKKEYMTAILAFMSSVLVPDYLVKPILHHFGFSQIGILPVTFAAAMRQTAISWGFGLFAIDYLTSVGQSHPGNPKVLLLQFLVGLLVYFIGHFV